MIFSRQAARVRRSALIPGCAFFALVALFMLLTACSAPEPDESDPLTRYQAALKPDMLGELAGLEQAPRYAIDVVYDPQENNLQGSADIVVYNTSADPWRYLVFRLYPALRQYGGAIKVQGAAVDGLSVGFTYEAGETALRVLLPQPLETGQHVTVRLVWKLTIPTWTDDLAVYALFGRSQQITSLPLFYPSLAVYQPGPAIGAGRWWLDTGIARGDSAFNQISFFVVTATLPANEVPVTSGTLISTTLINSRQARHVWVSGPSREFFLQMSPLFQSAYTETRGTRVTSFWLPGQEAAGRAALTYAIASLRIYSNRFGAYPFRDFRVAPAPINFRGMEYPQVALLGMGLYDLYRDRLEILVAHEVAHQWWYQIVHNDPVNEPWLDEALAEYSMRIYMDQLRGTRDASKLVHERWQVPLDLLKLTGKDKLVDQTVQSFSDNSQYETIVYGKGALFYDQLRKTLGDRQFFAFVDDYLTKHRWGIVDTKTWLADVAALNNPKVDALYQQWIAQPGKAAAETQSSQSDGAQGDDQ